MEQALAARAASDVWRWFDLVRSADGYGGPIAHWWRDCLLDCRPGYDWRYEGIIAGCLDLHERTGDAAWLARARRAGDELVAAHDHGHLRQSRFELNPGCGGTPHEAAAATGLLRLAARLASAEPDDAERYREVARAVLVRGHVARLWDAERGAFRDDPGQPSFVPNKACTLIEALLLLADATGEERYVAQYALPTASAVLYHQVRRPGGRLDGAIAQNSFGSRVVAKYFPYYVARCVPGLLAVHRYARDDRFADAALAAGRFVLRWRDDDGGFPQVVYADERVNRYPRWVAAVGDVLRALAMLRPVGLEADPASTEAWLLSGRLPTGGVMTARGFAAQAQPTRRPGPPEFRDLLSVAGWTDKAFRYFASRCGPEAAAPTADPDPRPHEGECVFRGRRLAYRADAEGVALRDRGRLVYRWRVGDAWAEAESWLAVR
ncbi:MAG TPA: hypothetical protein VG370_09805 [Chloroflexota bacterium]|nr:hypothetical protein [Chloroflexota bacterium]